MRHLFSSSDIVISIILLLVVYVIAHTIKERHIERASYYSHFTRALLIRIFSGLAFSAVYILYYEGGDTYYYFTGTYSLANMAHKDFGAFLQILLGARTPELFSLFDYTTGWPTYFKDANSWAVCRFSLPFFYLGLKSYFGTTIVMNAIFFIPIWRFYIMLVSLYPRCKKILAIALFYTPSVCFWSSGLLKDVWCMVGVFCIYLSFYMIFLKRRNIIANVIRYLFWAYILISIRPYSFYTVFAVTAFWLGLRYLKQFDSTVVRTLFFPIIFTLVGVLFYVCIDNVSSIAQGKYASVGSMMTQAVIIQDDLKRSYYGDNSFDIGTFDASISSMLQKLPIALCSGLYRPFLWECRSPFMLLSGIENTILLLLTIFLIVKLKGEFLRTFTHDNFLLSSLLYVIVFGFFIGLTIANFGALVRYRIILMPFFTTILGLLYHRYKELENQQSEQNDEDDDEENFEFYT